MGFLRRTLDVLDRRFDFHDPVVQRRTTFLFITLFFMVILILWLFQ